MAAQQSPILPEKYQGYGTFAPGVSQTQDQGTMKYSAYGSMKGVIYAPATTGGGANLLMMGVGL